MPLFGKSTKSPAELVKALKEAVNALERGDKKAEKAQEDVSKNLVSATYEILFIYYLQWLAMTFFVSVFSLSDKHLHYKNKNFLFFIDVDVVTIRRSRSKINRKKIIIFSQHSRRYIFIDSTALLQFKVHVCSMWLLNNFV